MLLHSESSVSSLTYVQITFVSSPDDKLYEKQKGPSNVEWRDCFEIYKSTILHFEPDHHACLPSWYDSRIFKLKLGDTVISSTNPQTTDQGYETEALFQHMACAEVETSSEPPTPLASPPLNCKYPPGINDPTLISGHSIPHEARAKKSTKARVVQ